MAATHIPTPTPLPLTFGLEFEHLLAFHSSLLLPLLSPTNTTILRSLPPTIRSALRQSGSQYLLTRSLYHGWALTSPTAYPHPFSASFHNECLAAHGCRGYADEVLRLETEVFRKRGGREVVVHDGWGKMREFGRWFVTGDTSLECASPAQLAETIGVERARSGEWDSGPVELVSRVLPLDAEESFEEVEEMLRILHGESDEAVGFTYKPFINQFCGLHVHIGLPPPTTTTDDDDDGDDETTTPTFTLPHLQHLAYITLAYEPALSLLHPPTRRPGGGINKIADLDLASNRDLFYPDFNYSRVDWNAVKEEEEEEMILEEEGDDSGYASGYKSDRSVYLKLPSPSKSVSKAKSAAVKEGEGQEEEAATHEEEEEEPTAEEDEMMLQSRFRSLIFTPKQTIKGLCALMSSKGQRGRVVNWTYIAKEDRGAARTVEFRQHEGCLDSREVGAWVRFCGELVRWAARGAEAEERMRRGSGGDEEGKGKERERLLEELYGRGVLGWEELVERMGLDGEGEEWVERRVEMWKEGGK
ncbi:MAG: hypothetical protein Q9208_002682 [Pyrenodesmia sp. 3 TL-2023]